MAQQIVPGSCLCGAIRFEVAMDPETAETYRCNCTFCTKNRYWGMWTTPEALRPLQGNPAPQIAEQPRRCPGCGVLTYAVLPPSDWNPEPRAVISVAALDLAPDLFGRLKIVYYDGRNDHWERVPAVTSYL